MPQKQTDHSDLYGYVIGNLLVLVPIVVMVIVSIYAILLMDIQTIKDDEIAAAAGRPVPAFACGLDRMVSFIVRQSDAHCFGPDKQKTN